MQDDAATTDALQSAERKKERAVKEARAKGKGAVNVAVVDPYEYKLSIACGYRQTVGVRGSDDSGRCAYALKACTFRVPPSEGPLYLLWQRLKEPDNLPWQLAGDYCRLSEVPVPVKAPPAVPTMGQIQTAFKRLPFSKPTVQTQPSGHVTLVNLPTYYRATWPNDDGLQPGEVSTPVQLLAWSVEFRISSRSYDFHYGDGTSSGPVTDAGGTYPDGAIRHTFDRAIARAPVSVDSQLTGEFRVNGGDWVDIDTVADLQGEPVTTLVVKEAHARLVSH